MVKRNRKLDSTYAATISSYIQKDDEKITVKAISKDRQNKNYFLKLIKNQLGKINIIDYKTINKQNRDLSM